jgi:hypothetical protein
MPAIEERETELRGILADIYAREHDLSQEREFLSESKKQINRELYLLGGRERSTPLFNKIRAAIKD